jgi:ribosomal protein S18 acetylase RimI-like enzyme
MAQADEVVGRSNNRSGEAAQQPLAAVGAFCDRQPPRLKRHVRRPNSYMLQLVQPDSPELWLVARRLVEEYAASLNIDLCFQDFAHELDTLASEYGPPGGHFVLASWSEAIVGCGGLRRLSDSTCEMKRLYIAPTHRGKGLGQAVAGALITQARHVGYTAMVLDTLPSMAAAQHIYRALGFATTIPYRHNPLPGATFLKLQL